MVSNGKSRAAWCVACLCASAVIIIVWGAGIRAATGDESAAVTSFERDAWPVLAVYCTGCHGGEKPKGGLDLRSVSSIVRGGESGPALVKSHPERSLLLERMVAGEMPPPKERRPSSDEVARVRAWIRAGAPAENPDTVPPPVSPVSDADRRFWSFRPLAAPQPPRLSDSSRARTPIDEFLLEKLQARELTFSADADPATLARRAYLDLVGLPPAPQEVDAFVADREPGAFERLVERLLASPHFGERWGRHWLDVAGYVDTVGFDTDATLVITSEGKWRYRDYVIRAFNDDKPFNRFLVEQLAGDELFDWRRAARFTPEIREALVATGYLRTARDLTHEDVGVIPQNFYGIMHDTLEIVGTGLLGLTLHCARCHSHKFDPIPQEDYYRLMAMLAPSYNPQAWRPVVPTETRKDDRGLADVSPAEQARIEQHNAEVDKQLEVARKALAELRGPHEARLAEARLAGLPEVIRADVKAAVETAAGKRNEVQKYLAEKFAAALKVTPEQVAAEMSDAQRAAAKQFESQIASTEARRIKWGKIQALYDVGPPPETYLLVRGSELAPGTPVQPGFLRVLCRTEAGAVAEVGVPVEGTSGRRSALARWLTAPDSPASALVARVMVNRVWQQLFGRGIVPTADNFGAQGQAPTHPELLEWLGRQLVEGGWRVKPLVKQIVLSTAYRQASRREPCSATADSLAGAAAGARNPEIVDPANELLWRMRLRRLESEVVRDSILAVSGRLNPAMGGPPVPISAQADGMVVVARERLAHPADAWRRSVYLTTRRAYNLSLLTVFDQPLVATNCVRRDESAVPLQSLVMLNDAFVAEQAEQFARRIEQSGLQSRDQQIEMAFRLALVRGPNAQERATCSELVERQADAFLAAGAARDVADRQALGQLCHVLFNSSEFLYAE
jgi:hypothetical protein